LHGNASFSSLQRLPPEGEILDEKDRCVKEFRLQAEVPARPSGRVARHSSLAPVAGKLRKLETAQA